MLIVLNGYAERISVVVEAYNRVGLYGTVPDGMGVSFMNDTKSAGRISSGNTATMVWTGLPLGIVNQVTLWMHSNTTGGAGIVAITDGTQVDTIAYGVYRDWPGMETYSAASRPLHWQPTDWVWTSDKWQVVISGTANSVYLDSVVVTYTPIPPQAYTVTLCTWTDSGLVRQTLTENAIGSGVLLPDVVQQTEIDGQTWYGAGWSENSWDETYEEPLRWEGGDTYLPDKDVNLYAVFRSALPQACGQDTFFRSGEYAMACVTYVDCYAMPHGAWTDGKIPTICAPVQLGKDGYEWQVDTVPAAMRYQWTFEGDSVTIYHPATRTWIGHNKSGSSTTKTKWAWLQGAGHTVYVYSTLQPKSTPQKEYMDGMSLYVQSSLSGDGMNAIYGHVQWQQETAYWILFPTTDLPYVSETRWTTFGYETEQALQSLDALPEHIGKRIGLGTKMLNNGRIAIWSGQAWWNILGQKETMINNND